MKKRNIALPLAAAFALTVSLTACAGDRIIGGADAQTNLMITETRTSVNEGADAGSPNETRSIADNYSGNTNTNINANTSYIDAYTAEQAALNHAGLSADGVTGLSAVFDQDRYEADYDVTFIGPDGTRYEYEINAFTGEVIKYEVDKTQGGRTIYDYHHNYSHDQGYNQPSMNSSGQSGTYPSNQSGAGTINQPESGSASQPETGAANQSGTAPTNQSAIGYNNQSGTGAILSTDQIISILHARVSAINDRSIEIELDHERGRTIYEGEFRADSGEYEFEIDATTGEILKWEQDRW